MFRHFSLRMRYCGEPLDVVSGDALDGNGNWGGFVFYLKMIIKIPFGPKLMG